MTRRSLVFPAAIVVATVVAAVVVLVVLVRQVVGSVAAGDAACAVALVPFTLLAAWRGRQIGRRLGAGR